MHRNNFKNFHTNGTIKKGYNWSKSCFELKQDRFTCSRPRSTSGVRRLGQHARRCAGLLAAACILSLLDESALGWRWPARPLNGARRSVARGARLQPPSEGADQDRHDDVAH